MSKYRLQLKPKPSQWLLYVDLEEIKSRSVTQALTLLEQMGYDSQLRYWETNKGVKLYALLKDEQHDPTESISDEYGFDELMALFRHASFFEPRRREEREGSLEKSVLH